MRDVERFWRYVVKGPSDADCWLWTGAVGDDGYGRFWTKQDAGGQRTMRPQRFLYRELTGIDLPPEVMLLHRCDIPICVHVDLDPQLTHVRLGNARLNQQDASRAGRHRNRFTVEPFASAGRAERVARSRRLRDAVRTHGWNPEEFSLALSAAGADQPTLW